VKTAEEAKGLDLDISATVAPGKVTEEIDNHREESIRR
jgi:hypothetical protein